MRIRHHSVQDCEFLHWGGDVGSACGGGPLGADSVDCLDGGIDGRVVVGVAWGGESRPIDRSVSMLTSCEYPADFLMALRVGLEVFRSLRRNVEFVLCRLGCLGREVL